MKSIVFISLVLTGCSSITGNLRRDLDDSPSYYEPTVGGAWPEGSLLERDMAVGHVDRNIASQEVKPGQASQWVNQANQDANIRDQYRDKSGKAMSYANNPNYSPTLRRQYREGTRARRSDFVDDSQNEGSLWASDGQTNYFFTKNKIKDVGDIITLTIEEPMVADVGMEIKRTLSEKEMDAELEMAQTRIKTKATEGKAPAGGAAPAGKDKAPVEEKEVEVPKATTADVDVKPNMELKANDTMFVEITDRYPNGNYKIQGTKRVPYRGTTRVVSLVGIARAADLNEQEQIQSGKLYEYRLKAARQ